MLGIKFKQIEGNEYRDNIGILAGTLYGSLENCHISNATVNIESIDGNIIIGGVVGDNSGYIKNCTADVDINSNIASVAGGIAGEGGQITKCGNFGNITVNQLDNYNIASVGGIVGSSSVVDRCYNVGNVTCIKSTLGDGVSDTGIGGIIGRGSSVTNCYNKGIISGDRLVGGIVGYGNAPSIYNSYSTGNIICDDELKGNIIAKIGSYDGIVENCYYLKNGIQGIASNEQGATFLAKEMTENQMKEYSFMEKLNLNDTAYLWNSNINDGYPYIDFEAPNVQVKYEKNEKNSTIKVTLQGDEKLKKKNGFELLDDGMQLVKEYYTNYEEDITIEDINGNNTIVSIKVEGIVENDKQIYNVYTKGDLIEISDKLKAGENFENKVINLMNNIKISDNGNFLWEPMGTFSIPFKGTFLGNNHTISGIYSEGYAGEKGFFGVCLGATITNLKLDNVYFSGYAEFTGGLAAYTDKGTTIKNCEIDANLNIDSSKRNTVYTGRKVGILVGSARYSIIESCVTKGNNKLTTVFGDSVGLGGVIGERYYNTDNKFYKQS